MQRRTFALAAALAACGGAALAAAPAPIPDRLLRMQPLASTQPGETHAVLAVSHGSFGAGGTPYTFRGELRTVRQLRTPAPNAWEVAWIVWNYADNDHLYYVVLKPNGWEIGKRDPRYAVPGVNDGQKIIATGESLKLQVGRWYRFEVKVAGAQAQILVDGVPVAQFRDTDSAPLLGGRVGLYGEDALCEWRAVSAPFADTFAGDPLQALADGSQLAHWRVVFLGYGSGAVAEDPAWAL